MRFATHAAARPCRGCVVHTNTAYCIDVREIWQYTPGKMLSEWCTMRGCAGF